MRREVNSDSIFEEINTFFDDKMHAETLAMGNVTTYEAYMQAEDRSAVRGNYWVRRMNEFVENPPPAHPFFVDPGTFEKIAWWAEDERMKSRLADMIAALEIIMLPEAEQEDVFGNGYPFLYFRRAVLNEEVAEKFNQRMTLSLIFAWEEKFEDDLWSSICKKSNQMLNELHPGVVPENVDGCELYLFEPPSSLDPYVTHCNANGSFYGLFVADSSLGDLVPPTFIMMSLAHGYGAQLPAIQRNRAKVYRARQARIAEEKAEKAEKARKAEELAKNLALKRASGSGRPGRRY